MHRTPRRALLWVALVAATFEVGHAQTACDQLLPIGLLPPAEGLGSGCEQRYVLRPGPGSGPGAYSVPLAYAACASGPCAGRTGLEQFICEMRSGHSCCIHEPQLVPILAGNVTGPLRLGLDQRIADDTDTRADICHADYAGNGSRLGTVPLVEWDGIGSSQVRVVGFVRMFLAGPPYSIGLIPVEFVFDPTPARSVGWGQTKIRYR